MLRKKLFWSRASTSSEGVGDGKRKRRLAGGTVALSADRDLFAVAECVSVR